MKKYTSLLLGFTLLFACEDVVGVEDITAETVVILAPADNSTIDDTTVSFSWETMSGAETYQLQIAIPTFEQATEIVVDTTTMNNQFQKELESGDYQWRIRALNSAYQTEYNTRNLIVQ
ncbi:hypothetical protein ACFQ1M_08450 [Sungkyunkwania multivorans]|uniref:Uncharacterized protein n=1 Tax=Sungkyunkwania multivorans TaxID=1173618 RepID=A0ABW3CX48_9FLAO